MQRLIQFALSRRRTVTVCTLLMVVLGALSMFEIPVDILPASDRPAVEILTFYRGMPADDVASSITVRMERWTGTVGGIQRQESRSILGASVVRNYFRPGVNPASVLSQSTSLALADMPNLPPGTLPPVIMPFDPAGTMPICLVALESNTVGQAILYDVGRYEVRNMIMGLQGTNAPIVAGGMNRVVLAYLDRTKLQARNLSPLDVMTALDNYNQFLPSGGVNLGDVEYMLGSNSLYTKIDAMRDIPIRQQANEFDFLGDVATPSDSHLIQETLVRVNGRRQVYIPVFKQPTASTLSVVDELKKALPNMPQRLTHPDTKLDLVMDQSVYVRESIRSLILETILGAVLCSLVILLFLGQLRMTGIAILMIPLALLTCIAALYYCGYTINVMTLAGMALAIGPLVDLAIVVLENTYRHLKSGATPDKAALDGASEIVLPEIVATFSTLLVLAPLALLPGAGQYLFRPLSAAVAFTMLAGMLLALSFVPSRCGIWLKPIVKSPDAATNLQDSAGPQRRSRRHWLRYALDWLDGRIEALVGSYASGLRRIISRPWIVLGFAALLLGFAVFGLTYLRREFFPTVDAGAFEMTVRAQTGTKLVVTERRIAQMEQLIRRTLKDDVQLIIDEIGVRPDWSAGYTPNAGPMDAAMKIQLTPERIHSTEEAVELVRQAVHADPQVADLEVAFDASGIVGRALNEGQATPITVRVTGRDMQLAHDVASRILRAVESVDGVVDPRIVQRLDYPQYKIDVDREKARTLGFTQEEVMKNVIAAMCSSIQFNKNNFWIDPVTKNQYYVGVQYPEKDIQSLDSVLNVPLTSPHQSEPVPLGNLVSIRPSTMAAEVKHDNLQTAIELTMNIAGRDLGHVADDVQRVIDRFGKSTGSGKWAAYDPHASDPTKAVAGIQISLSGEFDRMRETFWNFGSGILLALIFVYCLMVMLLDSYVVPLVILAAVPVGLIGVVPVLYLSGTAAQYPELARGHLHDRHYCGQHGFAGRFRAVLATRWELAGRRGDWCRPQASPSRGDDRTGRLFRLAADGVGHGAWQRGKRAARPRGSWRAGRRPAGNADYRSNALRTGRTKSARARFVRLRHRF